MRQGLPSDRGKQVIGVYAVSMDSLRHATADRLLSGRRLSKTAMTGAPIWRRSRKGRDSDMAAHPEASQDGAY